jgi:hypothetical protein
MKERVCERLRETDNVIGYLRQNDGEKRETEIEQKIEKQRMILREIVVCVCVCFETKRDIEKREGERWMRMR